MTDNAIGDFGRRKDLAFSQIYSQLLTDRYSVGAQMAEVRRDGLEPHRTRWRARSRRSV